MHAPRLASTSNQLLCTGTGTPAPLLVTGLVSRQNTRTNQHAPRCSYCLLRGTRSASSATSAIQSTRAPSAPYSAMQSAGALHSTALQPMTGMPGLISPCLMPVHCILCLAMCMSSYMPRPHSTARPPGKLTCRAC